jgi:chemotaxis protein CheD
MKYSVDIAMMKVAYANDLLYCLGLGSCVGVAVYDPVARVGGLLHVLLPAMHEFSQAGSIRTKFADTGIADLVNAVIKSGAARSRLKAKMAGGAAMFSIKGAPQNDALAIGRRNVQSCRDTLKRLGIELIAQDIGGTKGRTVIFNVETGELTIRIIDKGEKVI